MKKFNQFLIEMWMIWFKGKMLIYNCISKLSKKNIKTLVEAYIDQYKTLHGKKRNNQIVFFNLLKSINGKAVSK